MPQERSSQAFREKVVSLIFIQSSYEFWNMTDGFIA